MKGAVKGYTYKGRVLKPSHRTHAGVKFKAETVGIRDFGRMCDLFMASRGLPVGMTRMDFGKEDEP